MEATISITAHLWLCQPQHYMCIDQAPNFGGVPGECMVSRWLLFLFTKVLSFSCAKWQFKFETLWATQNIVFPWSFSQWWNLRLSANQKGFLKFQMMNRLSSTIKFLIYLPLYQALYAKLYDLFQQRFYLWQLFQILPALKCENKI